MNNSYNKSAKRVKHNSHQNNIIRFNGSGDSGGNLKKVNNVVFFVCTPRASAAFARADCLQTHQPCKCTLKRCQTGKITTEIPSHNETIIEIQREINELTLKIFFKLY